MSDASTFINELGIPGLSGLFNNDNEKALQQQMETMARAYRDYRGTAAQARQNQLGSQFDMYAPMQQYMSAMLPNIQPFDTQGALSKFGETTDALKKAAAQPTQGERKEAAKRAEAERVARRFGLIK